jgi:hypothetical protein
LIFARLSGGQGADVVGKAKVAEKEMKARVWISCEHLWNKDGKSFRDKKEKLVDS